MDLHRPRTGNRRDPNAHAAILAAAAEILAERGPSGFAIEAVARRAGVGKPTIYRWWPTRTALLLEVIEQEKLPSLQAIAGADLAEDLGTVMVVAWRFWRDSPSGRAYRGLLAEAQASEAQMHDLRAWLATRRGHVAAALDRARARGEVPGHVDAELLTDMLYGFCWYRLLTGQIGDEAAARAAGAALAAAARHWPPTVSPMDQTARPG